MAALRDIARDFAAEIRDGIGWTIVYRTGRSWNALTIWSDIWNGEWETDDLNDAIGILKADPDAVIVNGYYCGHFGEDMTIDEIAAGIRWHYEGRRNRLADYCEVTQGRDALEEGRKAAEAAGLPFCERLADGGDDELRPYLAAQHRQCVWLPDEIGRHFLPCQSACLPRGRPPGRYPPPYNGPCLPHIQRG